MYELLITEKPAAALKIAQALADGKPIKENNQGVPYYKITHGKKDIVVACAVGHLYGLEEKEGSKWSYPVFDIGWEPSHENKKQSEFTKKYLSTIKKLAKEAKEFTIATDYDVEGEVIGLNIVRYACGKKDANRMKFSTLTKDELVEAYENKSKTLDWPQAEAGETRHFLDWYNGINYSRALSAAIKTAGAFKIMSTGRVQGPALKIIVDREREIAKFKPVPYWQVQLLGEIKKQKIEAWHKEDKFWEKEKADKVMKNVNGHKQGEVVDIDKKQFKQAPPMPFDLTAMQIEAYKVLRIQPKETLSLAQELYTAGIISYPRTSSNQLSDKLGFKKILEKLKQNDDYKSLAAALLTKKILKPNNGSKTDPAHPAIYPTGEHPKALNDREAKLYDLIVRRFLATFADPALRETMTVEIHVNKEPFITKGTRTVEKGWHVFYGPYVQLEENVLPKVEKNDKVDVDKIDLLAKETQPPKRYTPSSIIKDLEKRNLGTKATRASIVDTLFTRNYVEGHDSIKATDFGVRTIETLEKYCEKIIDEELTRHFEKEMDDIREGKKKGEEVLSEAKEALKKIITQFKKQEKVIGKELLESHKETRDKMSTLGKCPVCKEGDLQIRKGKFGAFVACNKYPECKTTFSLPHNAFIKPADAVCPVCNFPMVMVIKARKQPQTYCLNPKCPSKHNEEHENIVEKPCPKCGIGKMVLKSSLYGKFLACNRYPECKTIEKIEIKEEKK